MKAAAGTTIRLWIVEGTYKILSTGFLINCRTFSPSVNGPAPQGITEAGGGEDREKETVEVAG